MEDDQVVRAFVGDGARRAFGPRLHVQGDGLFLDGWWQAAFRVGPEAFILRNEEAPEDHAVVAQVSGAFGDAGLVQIGVDLPAVTAITYTELDLGAASWTVWAPDLVAGEAALAARVGQESFFDDAAPEDPALPVNLSAGIGGARRMAGLPASVLLAVGLEPDQAGALARAIPDCHVEPRSLPGLEPEDCAALMPTMVVVDATTPAGERFVAELARTGRGVPILAVTTSEEAPLGADVTLSPTDASGWVEPIRSLL